jgi:hypothetical protein
VPGLLIGSNFYLRQATAAGPGRVAVLLLANVVIFMLGLRSIHTAFLPIDNSYLVSLAYTVAILLPCLDRRAPRALKFFGDSPIRSICCTARWASSWSSRRLPPAP